MEGAQRMWPQPNAHTRWLWRKQKLFEKGKCGGIKTSLWIDCLRNTDTAERIEANLGLTRGSFKKGRREERRKENTY